MPTKLPTETRLRRKPSDRLSVDSAKSLQILSHALVGVVRPDCRPIGRQTDPVISAVGQPFIQEARGEPAPPADLQPLVKINRIDGDTDIHDGDLAEPGHQATGRVPVQEQQVDERLPVLFLQRVIELAAPIAQHHRHADHGQAERDDREKQPARRPPLLRAEEVGLGKPPGIFQERTKAAHGASSLSADRVSVENIRRGVTRRPGGDQAP